MIKWNRSGSVVADVDGGAEALRVVDYAGAEALCWGVELILATPYAIASSSISIEPEPAALSAATEIPAGLHSAVDRARRNVGTKVPLRLVTGEGPRLKVMPEAAQGAQLLVISGRRTHGSRALAAAQNDLTLSSRVSCPTTVVPQAWEPSDGVRGVLVGVDGTALSTEALGFAFRTAAERLVPLTVVHVAPAPRRSVGGQAALHHAERVLSEVLAGWTDQHPEVELCRVASEEPAASALLNASDDAELMVLGAQATGLAAFNPVARRIIATSKCPVVILPHHVDAAEREISRRELRSGTSVVPPTY